MNRVIKKIIYTTSFGVFSFLSTVYPTHNVSRYFPLLERTEDYVIKQRSHVTPSFFILDASTAFRHGGGNGGIQELWGRYDLKDVVASFLYVNPTAPNPLVLAAGNTSLNGKSIIFKAHGEIDGVGFGLNYEQDLHWLGFQVGASLPFMSIRTTSRFDFNRGDSAPIFQYDTLKWQYPRNPDAVDQAARRQELVVDKARRITHQMINFSGNTWSATNIGDLDVHARWNHIFDHALLTKSIDINLQLGSIMPTGKKADYNYPCSVPFGSNGHWGLYADFITEVELKQDWHLGFIFGYAHLFSAKQTLRIPVNYEPAIFSSLIGRVDVEPGDTFKISPYFTLENLTDGLHFQLRYTYLKHDIDTWKDVRDTKMVNGHIVQSYLDRGGSVVFDKKTLSKWSVHYLTFELLYDTSAMKHVTLKPVIFVDYDMPMNGNGFAKTHQLSAGVELHF